MHKFFTLALTTILIFGVSGGVYSAAPQLPPKPSQETLDALYQEGVKNQQKYGAWPEGVPKDVKSSGETGLPPAVSTATPRAVVPATPSMTPTLLPPETQESASAAASVSAETRRQEPQKGLSGFVSQIKEWFNSIKLRSWFFR